MGPIRELGPAALLKVRPEDVRALTEVVRTYILISASINVCVIEAYFFIV